MRIFVTIADPGRYKGRNRAVDLYLRKIDFVTEKA